uniref:Candidate secreted effector n=1 Tax=Meloidogyne incognita TaxID=6306 RepID=A0A914LS23_MELIC
MIIWSIITATIDSESISNKVPACSEHSLCASIQVLRVWSNIRTRLSTLNAGQSASVARLKFC